MKYEENNIINFHGYLIINRTLPHNTNINSYAFKYGVKNVEIKSIKDVMREIKRVENLYKDFKGLLILKHNSLYD